MMRDYYLNFVSNQGEKTQNRTKTKGTKGAEDPFVPFAPSVDSEYSEKLVSECALNSNVPKNDIFEERVAIMMFEGGLSEAEAIQYLVGNWCFSTIITESKELDSLGSM
jgi:hypothetical protein